MHVKKRDTVILIAVVAVLVLVSYLNAPDTPAIVVTRDDERSSAASRPVTPTPQTPATATPTPVDDSVIYALDPENGDLVTRLHVVDPKRQQVVRTARLRYAPELAFSPDGSRLYAADSYYTQVTRGRWREVLSVYDPNTFDLLHDEVAIPDRLMYKVFPAGHRHLFVGPDGRQLFVRKYGDPDVHDLRLAVLDTETFAVLAEYPACPNGILRPLSPDRLVCVDGATLQTIDALSGVSDEPLRLPISGVAAVYSQPADRLYLVSENAEVATVDVAAPTPQLVGTPTSLAAPPGAPVAGHQAMLSADGSRLYVRFLIGDWRARGLDVEDEIRVYNIHTWEHLGTITPSVPAFDVAVDADGHYIYAVNPHERTLSIFDASTFEEVGVMRNVGETPAQVIVPPARTSDSTD